MPLREVHLRRSKVRAVPGREDSTLDLQEGNLVWFITTQIGWTCGANSPIPCDSFISSYDSFGEDPDGNVYILSRVSFSEF